MAGMRTTHTLYVLLSMYRCTIHEYVVNTQHHIHKYMCINMYKAITIVGIYIINNIKNYTIIRCINFNV
jgi:hypothetical protein